MGQCSTLVLWKNLESLSKLPFPLIKMGIPPLCRLIYLQARQISITSPDISVLPQCITHHLYLFTGLISNFRPFLPSVWAVQSWYQPPLSRWVLHCFNNTELFFLSYFTGESIQMKSCPYTFYHNKGEGFPQKIPMIHRKTLIFSHFKSTHCEAVNAFDKGCFPSLTSQSWCAPCSPHPAPSSSKLSRLNFKMFKMSQPHQSWEPEGSGQLAATTSPPNRSHFRLHALLPTSRSISSLHRCGSLRNPVTQCSTTPNQ